MHSKMCRCVPRMAPALHTSLSAVRRRPAEAYAGAADACRSAARLQLPDFQGAAEDCRAAIQLHPSYVKPYFRLAKASTAMGQHAPALAAAKEALRLAPQNAEVGALVIELQKNYHLHSHGGFVFPRAVLPSLLSSAPIETAPSPDGMNDGNLLLLLHGLGDGPLPFIKLAKSLSLPQTCCVALGGPFVVPFTDGQGRSWFTVFDDDMELIKAVSGEQRRVSSLAKTAEALFLALEGLVQAGWAWSRLHLFGFSQGGTLALEVARRAALSGTGMGSCVAVASGMLAEQLVDLKLAPRKSDASGCSVPVLLVHGGADEVVAPPWVKATADFLGNEGLDVEVHCIEGKSHSVVASAEEARLLMQFWAKHLSSKPAVHGGELIDLGAAGVRLQQVANRGP